MGFPDVERLKTLGPSLEQALNQMPKKLPRHKQGEPFVKGPLPVAWFGPAAALPRKALAVGLTLWFKGGFDGKAEIKLSGSLLRKFGIKRDAARRGLAALEKGGLVSVQRHPGRCPLVQILNPPDDR